MNRRPERKMRFYYKSRNWNSFDDGKFYRRKWHELDDIWKPNYDYDDFNECVDPRSANAHVQKLNYYNNRYLQPTFSNYRNNKQELHLTRESNSWTSIQKVPPNSNQKTKKNQCLIQNSTNTNFKNSKVSEEKKETVKDTIAEELELIHGESSDEINKDCETSAKQFNINTRLSYLENYPNRTSELTRKQIRGVQSTKSTTEVETSSHTNAVTEKKPDKEKLHKLGLKHDGGEHNTNNNTKLNQIVLNTCIKTQCKQDKDKLLKVSCEDVKKVKDSKFSIKTNSCKMEELTEKCAESTKMYTLENPSKNTIKLSKDTKKVYDKDEVETKDSFRKRKQIVDNCPTVQKQPKIVGDKLSYCNKDLMKQSLSLERLQKPAKISGRRNTVALPSECDNSTKVFNTMEDTRASCSVTVIKPKLSLNSTNNIEKVHKISKRRMTVSVPSEPGVSLVKISNTVIDKSTLPSVDVIKHKLNFNSINKSEKLAKISKSRMTVSVPSEPDVSLVKVSNTKIDKSTLLSLNPINNSEKLVKISNRRMTVLVPSETDVSLVKVSNTMTDKSTLPSVDVMRQTLKSDPEPFEKSAKMAKHRKTVQSPSVPDIVSDKISKTVGNNTMLGDVNVIKQKCASISNRRQTVTVSSFDTDGDLTKITKNSDLTATRNRRSKSTDSRETTTISRITRSKSKELKSLDLKHVSSSKQSKRNLLHKQHIYSSSDKKHTPVEKIKSLPKVGRPRKIPHTPKEENMPDPRLQKSDECRLLSQKPDNSKVDSSAGNKIRYDRSKCISEDDLNFLFNPNSNKKKGNSRLSNAKSATTWNLKKLDPFLTSSKPTTSWNLNELNVSDEQLKIFFKVHNAPEEIQSTESETTFDLEVSNYSQLLVNATETEQISTAETAHVSYSPEVSNDQKVVTQTTKSGVEQIIRGQKQLVCNVKNVGGVLVPNWTTNECSSNNTQSSQHRISENVPNHLSSSSDTISDKSANSLINLNRMTERITERITHEKLIQDFYHYIFMYCDTYQILLSKMVSNYSSPQQQITKELQDFTNFFKMKMRRFTDSLCTYLETRFISPFTCKALIWHVYEQYFKHTGQKLLTINILQFFYSATKDIRAKREPVGFLKDFCEEIEKTYRDCPLIKNVPAHSQSQENPQNRSVTQQNLQNVQHQSRQHCQISQNVPVLQQPQHLLQNLHQLRQISQNLPVPQYAQQVLQQQNLQDQLRQQCQISQNVPVLQQPQQVVQQQNLQYLQHQLRQISQNVPVPQQSQQILQPQNQSLHRRKNYRQLTQKLQLPQKLSQSQIKQLQTVPHQQLQSPRVSQLQSQHQTPPPPYSQAQQNVPLPPQYHRSQQIEKLPSPPPYSESQQDGWLRQLQHSGRAQHPQDRSEVTEVKDTRANKCLLTDEQQNVFKDQCSAYNALVRNYQLRFQQPPVPTSISQSSTSILQGSSTVMSSPNRNLPTDSTGLLSNEDHIQRTTELQSDAMDTTNNPTIIHTNSSIPNRRTSIVNTFDTNVNTLQSDASSLLNKNLLENVEHSSNTSLNSIETTDNFKIRLPLSHPLNEEKYSSTDNVSLTTNSNTETLVCNSDSINVDQKPKPEILSEPEIIDVDEWFITSLKSNEIIDLDYYFCDDEIKTEESEKVLSETSNVNSMDIIPRIGSVDSGYAHSPNQIEHPDVLSGERICICTKIAEQMCLCGKAIYCSTDCQRADWDNHKVQCMRTREVSKASPN